MAKLVRDDEMRQKLVRGRTAAVYLAYDPQLGCEVAPKLMDQQPSANPAFAARFERHATTGTV